MNIRLRDLGLLPPPWCGPMHSFPSPVPSADLRDRYRGCLVGGAIGDALGRPAEGRRAGDLRRRYPDGLRDFEPWWGRREGPVGTFTDDTQLTIVTAEWLVASHHAPRPEDLASRVVEWGRTGRGIGAATGQALRNYAEGLPWWQAAVPSAGNGGAMRAAPYGLRYAGRPDALRTTAALGTAVTHADPTAAASAIVQAVAVNQCLSLMPDQLDPLLFLEAVSDAIRDLDLPSMGLRSERTSRTLLEQVSQVRDCLGLEPDEVFAHFYNGAYVIETTPVVLWLFLTSAHDPEEALVTAVMGGGDADTNAAMLGNLLGALHGLDAFPERWAGHDLEDFDRLVGLADSLYDRRWPEPWKWWRAHVQSADVESTLAPLAGTARGFIDLRVREKADLIGPDDPVVFTVGVDPARARVFAVGRVAAAPIWTVTDGDPGEDQYVVRQVVTLEYLELRDLDDGVELGPESAAVETTGVYPVDREQWQALTAG